MIIDFLEEYVPIGNTPLYCAMDQHTKPLYVEDFPAEQGDSYLIVVSDGMDTCGSLPLLGNECHNGWVWDVGDWTVFPDHLTSKTEELLELGIKTIAIGFGEEADPEQLNAIAAAGGTSFTEYIQADDDAELNAALDSIASEVVVNCIYDIELPEEESVDPEEVNFYFDGEVVPYDEDCGVGIGWTWVDPPDNTQVEFCEGACEQLQSEVEIISAKWGCPTVYVE
jgi:hypothetical protein